MTQCLCSSNKNRGWGKWFFLSKIFLTSDTTQYEPMKNLSLKIAAAGTKSKFIVVMLIGLLGAVLGFSSAGFSLDSLLLRESEATIPVGTGALIGLLVGFAVDVWLRSYAWNKGIPDSKKPAVVRLYLDLIKADGTAEYGKELAVLPEIQKIFFTKASSLSTAQAVSELQGLNDNEKKLLSHHFECIKMADGFEDSSEDEMIKKFKKELGID